MAVLFIQVVALATQVKRPENARAGSAGGGTRLIRVWTVTAFTPIEKMFVSTGHFFRNGWNNYADLRGVRKQNRELQEEVARLQMEQVRLKQDADQARRLQALLEFKESFISRTVAAQVIGTSGTEQSRVIIIDKGSHDGIKPDMAVITPDGIVGKIKDVFPLSSQVLLINDHDSGAGVILERSRLQGIVKGTSQGELQVTDIMSDEKIEAGDHVITSGGDRIYPKGFSVGTVINATADRDNDPFLVIKIKPSADLRRLEEVMVVTKMAEETPAVASGPAPMRAADILAQRLPSVPKQDANAPKSPGASTPATGSSATGGGTTASGPPSLSTPAPKPSPTPAKASPTAGAGVQRPGAATTVPGQAKQPVAGTQPAAGAGTTAIPVPATKTAAQGKKPASAGQTGPASTGSAPAGSGGSATPTPPKPKAAPKKATAPAPQSASPGASEPKVSEQPLIVPPAATPTPTPENRPR